MSPECVTCQKMPLQVLELKDSLTVSLSMSSPGTPRQMRSRPKPVGKFPRFLFCLQSAVSHGTPPCRVFVLSLYAGGPVFSQRRYLPAGKGKTPRILVLFSGGAKKPLTVSAAASNEACPRWAYFMVVRGSP